jgi:biopolymer transport protein ExbD
MFKTPKHRPAELTTSSVADIAFLLLTFFLITTQIEEDKGLSVVLPRWSDAPVNAPFLARNVFVIHINSNDDVMIEGEISSLAGLKERVREFILNYGRNANLSEEPEKAVVSLKTDRGTSHERFVEAMDEIQGAYYEIYARRLGLTVEQYRKLSIEKPGDLQLINKAKEGIPMAISLAEPNRR